MILRLTAPNGKLIAVDIDPYAIERAKEILGPFGKRALLVNDSYVNIVRIAERAKIGTIDGILLDLGISSEQLENASSGFSFQRKGPLVMTFSGRKDGLTAEQVINSFSELELYKIITEYGEERYARSIVKNILAYRERARITDTAELARIISESVPQKARWRSRIHPATKTFQAIRMYVNDELHALQSVIPSAFGVLKRGGRLGVISFHSLEDRIVKIEFKKVAQSCECPPDFPVCACRKKQLAKLVTKKAIKPSAKEQAENQRSRSARLRVIEKI
jgi:16S rRNA (cytosine1402-N4)-methyltransferase